MNRIKGFFQKEIVKNLLITIILSGIFCIITFQNGAAYSTNDDVNLKSIVSGQYLGEPSMNMIFVTFPVSTIMYGLYNIAGGFDWYGLVQIIAIVFFLGCVVYFIIKQVRETYKKVLCASLIFFLISLVSTNLLTHISFTTTAGFISICSLVLFMLPTTKIKNLLILLSIILAFGFRNHACLMVLPLFVPVWLYKNWGDRKKLIKDGILGAVMGMLILSCGIVEKVGIMTGDWSEFLNYNNSRSLYHDYYYDAIAAMPEDEKRELFYAAGFSVDEQKELEIGLYAFNEELYQKIDSLAKQYDKWGLKKATTKEYISIAKDVVGKPVHIFYVGTLVVLVYLFAKNSSKKKYILKVAPFIGVQLILLAYLLLQGRFPPRVYIPLYFSYIVTNLYVIMNEVSQYKKEIKIEKSYKFLIGAASVVLVILSANNMQYIKNERDYVSNLNATILGYFDNHPDNTYIFTRDMLDLVTIKNDYKARNYIAPGYWIAHSPLFYEKLENYGVDSLSELLFMDDVYFVTEKENVKQYLNDKAEGKLPTSGSVFDNISLEKMDSINGKYDVYKIRKMILI